METSKQPRQPRQPGQPGQPRPKPSEPSEPSIDWVVTKGAKQLPNFIAIHLFRHYERTIKTYQIIALGYTDKEQTQLGIYEAEEIRSYDIAGEVYEGLLTSLLFKHWSIETIQYRYQNPCILVLVRIENDLILMTYEEFKYHQGNQLDAENL